MQDNSGDQINEAEQAYLPFALDVPLVHTTRRSARDELYERYTDKMRVNNLLGRQLVSFQANKIAPVYRWFKYKEAFSSELVTWLLKTFAEPERDFAVLDPFAGAGTAIATAADFGCSATGIELLPVGVAVIQARLAACRADCKKFENYLNQLKKQGFSSAGTYRYPHIRITQKAFSHETEAALSSCMNFIQNIRDDSIRTLFHFACMASLEDVSFTRKDGQYLRWDARAGKSAKSKFKALLPKSWVRCGENAFRSYESSSYSICMWRQGSGCDNLRQQNPEPRYGRISS